MGGCEQRIVAIVKMGGGSGRWGGGGGVGQRVRWVDVYQELKLL